RLEWSGAVTLDRYHNGVQSATGLLSSALRGGNFFKIDSQGDLRVQQSNGTVNALRFVTTSSNDPAVLPSGTSQIGNFQIGHVAASYALEAGDVIPNFSPLSSALPLRGVQGRLTLGKVAVTAFSGVVAESWEALDQFDRRTQPLQAVRGLKLEIPLSESLRVHTTSQQFTLRPSTTTWGADAGLGDDHSKNTTLGLTYQREDFMVTAEAGRSRFSGGADGDRNGRAVVADLSWKLSDVSVRAGFHDVGSAYTSLSQAAMAGVRETYIAGNWEAGAWVTFGADVRQSRNASLPVPGSLSVTSETTATSVNANLKLGPDLPGWSLVMQHARSMSTSIGEQRQSNSGSGISAAYSSPEWSGNLGLSRDRVENSSYPEGDSKANTWSWSVRRALGVAETSVWTGAVGLSGRNQIQRTAIGRVGTADFGLQLSAERSGRSVINLSWTGGHLSQDGVLPPTRSRGLQVDASLRLHDQLQIKVYVRYDRRNFDDPILAVAERTVGLQLSSKF
ncbi:MAG TPA: hypothetical protein VK968_04935, partial [Roseimicrobium sp.]|nr:hypothetical protein [Roseimicrobium sp.]